MAQAAAPAAIAVTANTHAISDVLKKSFGVPMATMCTYATSMIADGDIDMVAGCLVAGVSAHKAMVMIAPTLEAFAGKYPSLFIMGREGARDALNFSAMRVVGHIIATRTGGDIATKILGKSGNCITGANCPDNKAGKINRETAASFTDADRAQATVAWNQANAARATAMLNTIWGA